ncbi:hypothetical protein C8Q74DRAFT_1307111 [Fomes fomentarius]|nr:hypothetical protein C8Q74DRAFT_1307111 [Fomes fomentarius]
MPYQYSLFAGTALLLYDTVLTFGTEVDVIWRRRVGIKTLIHILNRYGQIAAYIFYVVLLFPVNDRTCHSLSIFQSICGLLPNVAWSRALHKVSVHLEEPGLIFCEQYSLVCVCMRYQIATFPSPSSSLSST